MKNATNVKLESAEVLTGFATCKTLYLRLVYTYEDELGKHRLTFPAVNTTIPKSHLPSVICDLTSGISSLRPMDGSYIDTDDARFPINDVGFTLGTLKCRSYLDTIIEPAPKEMTLDEIEKKLGYKVKIINKE